MALNQLSQKISAIVIDGIERHLCGISDSSNIVDRIVAENMSSTNVELKEFMKNKLQLFRAGSVGRQKTIMGKYYNRHIIVKSSTVSSRASISSDYKTYASHIIRAKPEQILDLSGLYVRPTSSTDEEKYYQSISLELDRIRVITEHDSGSKTEPIVIGGASDGTGQYVCSVITQKKSVGEHEERYFHGTDRIAVPKWPLANDGTSKITFYGEVYELDSSDRNDIITAVGGIMGIVSAIIKGLVAGGIIGGPAGAVAGAIIGGIVGVIGLFVAFNSDDFWGQHEVNLFGPYEKTVQASYSFYQERKPNNEHYKLYFVRSLYND
jgi:hypothetical protein